MEDYLRLLSFIKPYKKLLGVASLTMAISAVFDGFSLTMIVPLADKILANKKIILPEQAPKFLDGFIEALNNIPALEFLKIMVVVILVLFLLKEIFCFAQGFLMADIGQRVVRDIRSQLYIKLQSLSLEYYNRKRGGELVSRITNDVLLVENALTYALTDLIYQSFQVIVCTILIFLIFWRLAFFALILLPLVSFPMIRIGKMLKKLSHRSQEKIADIHSSLYETIFGARIVKAFCAEEQEIKKFNSQNYDFYKIAMKSAKRRLILGPTTEYIGVIAAVCVFFWGGRAVILGKLSFGVFALFLAALLSLIRPFKKLSQVHTLNQQAIVASDRIYEVLNTEAKVKEKSDAKQLSYPSESIIFEGVHFAYDKEYVLCGIDLRVKVGQSVAIVGQSGVGKTTLVDLLLRFYDPQKGRILIDEQDIRDFTLKSLRQNIGLVSQEIILFNDTIKANITYGIEHFSEHNNCADKREEDFQKVIDAAIKAHAHDYIMNLPYGYDTVIGERGVTLSGGQRQRIAIARALLKNPPILVLDEATSHLDSASERVVQNALEELMHGRTVFIVAHRLSTVQNADYIIVLDKGKIVEQGKHTELLSKKGIYSRLYQIQSREE